MVDRQKVEILAKKQWREKYGYSLSMEDNRYNNNKIFNTNSNQKDGFTLRDD